MGWREDVICGCKQVLYFPSKFIRKSIDVKGSLVEK
jgi:hypothetical protein